LLEEFRLTPNAFCLQLHRSGRAWTVQGEQLSCVIIDRLPFAVPNDPVVAARIAAIILAGGNAFFEYQVPSGGDLAEQGFGP